MFQTEPLPKTSPLWVHPKVFVTPHASGHLRPRASGAAASRAEIARMERGESLENLVDRDAGY